MRLDILRAEKGLVVRHGLHALLAQGVQGRGVFPEVELGSDEDDGDVGRVMVDLGVPLEEADVSRRFQSARTTRWGSQGTRTLALTLSKDGGLTMEKQIRKTSVWG